MSTEPTRHDPEPQLRLHGSTAELFYTISVDARAQVDELLAAFRENTGKILAIATGALAVFGFESSHKGAWFVMAVALYMISAISALGVYSPVEWRINVAHDLVSSDSHEWNPADPIWGMTPARAHLEMGHGHQIAIRENAQRLSGKFGTANLFRAVVFFAAASVACGAINVVDNQGQQKSDESRTTVVEVESDP